MPTVRFHYSADRTAEFLPVATLPVVDAPTALDAAHAALAKVPPTLTAPSIWLRVVTTHPNGVPRQVLSVPLTATGQIPLDWPAPLPAQ